MLLTARWLQKDYGSMFITFFTFRLSILISYIKLFIIMLGVIITWELFKTNHSTFIAIVLFWLLSTIMQYTREKEIVAVCRMRRMRLQGIIKPANAKSFPAKKTCPESNNHISDVVLVSLLSILNTFHTFLLLTLSR